ncbi:N-TERMINAL ACYLTRANSFERASE COMPLEX (ARD) SUBUNIT [Encephalitozoon cuniculi GB-M1]|uniref:N-TERMINAL ACYLTRANSFERASE COMPLEX (ARD) SUBUNIT n=2 Tax=Encephalitozoon cuniculi TaxID=6035 RepID=Q8SRG8_ENCCU|nr:peptide alpha-N-acetyltransferase complex B subunit NAT3 [Encephalitozoon cuniculi GB-M1]AGE95875.1 n-terminal acyltransferase complex subunit [Encephalitozoon cuniculi]KMV65890.1 putative acetyltransferase [Encephalitozoon cuniculi EcunIII-L]UYI27331.1 N-alpha-acetyltransferase [Encephalitozoon cuniculi]CAD25699.1 N-TERMINAL ACYLTRANSFERASE COMPLEX (ARD) SUBUNIT [Encephalitozoon cuniculi GB-M1]
MYKIEPMLPSDILSLDWINLDETSESFPFSYYLYYLINYSEDCIIIPSLLEYETSFTYKRDIYGYMIGKLEEKDGVISAHASAVSVAPSYRRNRFGKMCMDVMEKSGDVYNAYFADLYVREGNTTAIEFYKKLGYVTYRKVFNYYVDGAEENALDMRKSLKMDKDKVYMARGVDIQASKLR